MEVKATFTYLNKTIQVLCKDDEDINKMYEKFAAKLSDGSEASHFIITMAINSVIYQQLEKINISLVKEI